MVDGPRELPYYNTSGHGKLTDVPAGVRRWNWGAFLLPVLWGPFNRTWTPLLFAFIPVVGIIVTAFVLGARGNHRQ